MPSHVVRILSLTLLGLAAAGCGSTDEPLPSPSPSDIQSSYPLRPGDVIRLEIWREPTLSGEFIVNETGEVTLPKIGTLVADELTASELEATVRERYDHYLRNPSIEVVMLRRVNILGAVRAPGLYPVDPTMTLRDAVALAGGVMPNGRNDQVDLLRGGENRTVAVTGATRVGDLGLRSGDQLYVPERSWLSRNAGVVASVASTVLSVTASLIIANNN